MPPLGTLNRAHDVFAYFTEERHRAMEAAFLSYVNSLVSLCIAEGIMSVSEVTDDQDDGRAAAFNATCKRGALFSRMLNCANIMGQFEEPVAAAAAGVDEDFTQERAIKRQRITITKKQCDRIASAWEVWKMKGTWEALSLATMAGQFAIWQKSKEPGGRPLSTDDDDYCAEQFLDQVDQALRKKLTVPAAKK